MNPAKLVDSNVTLCRLLSSLRLSSRLCFTKFVSSVVESLRVRSSGMTSNADELNDSFESTFGLLATKGHQE